MTSAIRSKILERLNFYSDRFSHEGSCGARPNGCHSNECLSRQRHFTDKNLYHTYGEFYADLISSFHKISDEKDISIMELGVYFGGSIAAWCESMPAAFVCGVDQNLSRIWIDPSDYSNLSLISGNHEEIGTYSSLGNRKFDLIIDDGSHIANHQITNFTILKNKLKDGGYYVIEDIYPENSYPDSFLSSFEKVDFSKDSGRGDDVLLVYKHSEP